MTRQELERWLCGPDERAIPPRAIASLLGESYEAVADTTLLRAAGRLTAARFVVAVLQDVFVDDGEVRAWLRRPRAEFEGRSAVEMLVAGRTEPVAASVTAEWHRGLGAPEQAPAVRQPSLAMA